MRPVFFHRDTKTRHEVYIFIACAVISLFLWFLIKASDESEATVSFPVEFVNIPENKMLVNSPVKQVTLGFEEKAANLFFYKYFKAHEPLKVSVNDLALKEQDGHYHARLFTTHIMDYLNKHQDIPYTIISISPDTIPVVFEDKASEMLPLDADIELSFKRQFELYDTIQIIPDSVLVSGPASAVKSLEKIDIGDYRYADLEETTRIIVDLEAYKKNDLLTFEPNEAEIVIPVEEYTEASAKVTVEVETDTGLTIRTFPTEVDIRYLVALRDYQDIRPNMFRAVVKADPDKLKNKQKLKVQLEEVPQKAQVLYVEPDKVEFIIIK